jgi:deoxyadenosine kinase
MFIGIAGVIGVGKTSLTGLLAKDLEYEAVYEPVETNPYLEDFYKDMARWTFPMQLFLLAKRFQLHQEVIWNPAHQKGGGVVQDRTIYEDVVFAKMHHDDGIMAGRDWDTYISHFNIMRRYLVYPDVIFYLQIQPEVAMERIRSRGRDAEREISLDYLRKLHEGYELFAHEMRSHTRVYFIDWSDFGEQSYPLILTLVRDLKDKKQNYSRTLLQI